MSSINIHTYQLNDRLRTDSVVPQSMFPQGMDRIQVLLSIYARYLQEPCIPGYGNFTG